MTDWEIPTQPPGETCYQCGRQLVSAYDLDEAGEYTRLVVACPTCGLAWPTFAVSANPSERQLKFNAAKLWKQRRGVFVQEALL